MVESDHHGPIDTKSTISHYTSREQAVPRIALEESMHTPSQLSTFTEDDCIMNILQYEELVVPVATKSQSRHGKSCKHCPICVYVGARPMFIPYVDIHCDDLVKIALVSLQASHRIVNKFDSLQTQLLCGIFSCRHMGLIIFSRCTYEVR